MHQRWTLSHKTHEGTAELKVQVDPHAPEPDQQPGSLASRPSVASCSPKQPTRVTPRAHPQGAMRSQVPRSLTTDTTHNTRATPLTPVPTRFARPSQSYSSHLWQQSYKPVYHSQSFRRVKTTNVTCVNVKGLLSCFQLTALKPSLYSLHFTKLKKCFRYYTWKPKRPFKWAEITLKQMAVLQSWI